MKAEFSDAPGTGDNTSGEKTEGQKLLATIQRAEKYRDKVGRKDRWRDIEELYSNDPAQVPTGVPNFNLIYMHGRAMVPTIVFRRPQILNTARRPDFIPWASFFDSIDQFLMEEMEVEDTLQDAVLEAYLFNTVGLHVGFDFLPKGMLNSKDRITQVIRSIEGFAEIPGVVDRARRYNFPFIQLVPAGELLFPSYSRNVRTAHWYSRACCVPVEDMREYLGRPGLKPTHVPEEVYDSKRYQEMSDSTEGFVYYYEFHNAKDRTAQLVTIDGEILKTFPKDHDQIDGLPVSVITFNKRPRSMWGTPDALYIEGQQLDGNDARVMGLRQRRIALIKALIDADMLDDKEAEKLYSDEALPLIRVKLRNDQRLADCIQTLQPSVQMQYLEYQKSSFTDSQYMLGQGANQMGLTPPGRRTKYETQVAEERSYIRTSDRREQFARAITDCFRKVNLFVADNWDQPILQRVLGVDASLYWVQAKPQELSKKQLKDELVTSVDVGSMAPRSLERDRQEMLQAMQIIGSIPNVNILPIIRQLLNKFPWAEVDQILPQASQDNALTMEQFQREQKEKMGSSETRQSLKDNMQRVMGAQ